MSGLNWVKSSFSDEGGNNCVEVAATEDGTALRESDEPGRILAVRTESLSALLAAVKQTPSP
ncbi:DUF397 domain-containing protein [Streptomyces sp. BH-SS-21]|uniref:DUF397 domain-containing protein n=1 Tax=Streptomyces liliiviolaceus TaxID=2823109 RepID=A0A941B9X4_9ACTN|nr:DUF397 domain-containing protein [Streptomyces liliiviolaceus]MBQ0853196.1 DUF397 domain-containing protein [Streptomyces liliiviolaceus]